jgi:hypothetical protein
VGKYTADCMSGPVSTLLSSREPGVGVRRDDPVVVHQRFVRWSDLRCRRLDRRPDGAAERERADHVAVEPLHCERDRLPTCRHARLFDDGLPIAVAVRSPSVRDVEEVVSRLEVCHEPEAVHTGIVPQSGLLEHLVQREDRREHALARVVGRLHDEVRVLHPSVVERQRDDDRPAHRGEAVRETGTGPCG